MRVNSKHNLIFCFLVFYFIFISISNGQVTDGQIENFQVFKPLSQDQKTLLEKNGFFVTLSEFDQIYQLYKSAAKQNLPIYVTTDAILHTFHVLFDYSLRVTELGYFYKSLADLTQGLLNYELAKLKQTKTVNAKAALKKNIAYLSVAAALLDEKFEPPSLVAKLVEAELNAINQAKEISRSEIFDYIEDYSQYKPRGHYTRNEKFQRYFKAMMWFGRIGFYLKPGNKKSEIEQGRNLTRQAILLVDALQKARVGNEPALKKWEQIYNPLTYIIGKTDDLTCYDYIKLINKYFPDKEISKKIETDKKIDEFIAEALKLPAPKILSTVVIDTTTAALHKTKGVRLFGQRYIPDAYIFQQLVYSKVGTQKKPRNLPKGLDVMAVLGSNRAQEILTKVYQENLFLNYSTQMIKLKTEFNELLITDWKHTIYFSWLYTLRLLLKPLSKSSELPEFLFTPAYADKTLMTACGSWTQLRHDTILYAKQSYTAALTSIQPSEKQPGYVEPYPKVYEQIASMSDKLEVILKQYSILSEKLGYKLRSFRELVKRLELISDKEIKGTELEDDELAFIKNIGESLEDITTFPAQSALGGYSPETDEKMAVVADVHTDPNSQLVLEEGVGNPFYIYALIPYQQKQYLAIGGVFSYYEFTKPIGERMTDEQWQSALSKEPKPDLPIWTNSFIVK
jgi:hypothetical protein